MSLYYPLLTAFCVSIGMITVILINRAKYKRTILKIKLQEYASKLKVGETYWYNSSKGLLNSTEPSCWAKVLSEPKLVGKNNAILIDVLLKVGTKRIEKTVPANSLAKIDQLNS